MKKTIVLILIFTFIPFILFAKAEPLVNPKTGEPGYWISEEDMTDILTKLTAREELEKAYNSLKVENDKLRKREGVYLGVGVGLISGIVAFIAFSVALNSN